MRTALTILTTALLLSAAPPAGAKTLTIYSSLPLTGRDADQAAAVLNGERRALAEAGGRAGDFDIELVSLDDATGRAGAWDPVKAFRNARRAAIDSSTIAYIGDFNSGASAISIPILNLAGIPQVSPSNTYVGLTTRAPGSEQGEPQRYYPTGERTYFRLMPNDRVQSAALVAAAVDAGCRRVGLADDGETYGDGIAREVLRDARAAKLRLPVAVTVGHRGKGGRALAGRLRRAHVDCFVFAGVTANGAIALFRTLAAADSHLRFLGADGICEPGFTRPLRSIADRFSCTIATPESGYEPFGYEAMKVLLDTITMLGPRGDDRAAVVTALQEMPDRAAAIGTYRFDRNGDTTITTYGIYGITRGGNLEFRRVIEAGPHL